MKTLNAIVNITNTLKDVELKRYLFYFCFLENKNELNESKENQSNIHITFSRMHSSFTGCSACINRELSAQTRDHLFCFLIQVRLDNGL